MSARSSDSDVSDVSAISRASSASRLSSASYMSVQSERPHGRIRLEKLYTHMSHICTCKNIYKHIQTRITANQIHAYDQDTFIFYSVFSFPVNNLRLGLSSFKTIFKNVCSYNHDIQMSSRQWSILFGFISFFLFALFCMLASIMHAAICLLSVSCPLFFFCILTLHYAVGVQRSKSLENCKGEEKRERRISWGVSGPGQRRSLGKRRFSEELRRRRHTVAGDVR